jgi:phospholipase C
VFAEEHHSEGNYFWLFSGSNQNVEFSDRIPDARDDKNYPFVTRNLGEELIRKGRSFRGYSEGLPEIGGTECMDAENHYARKHVPWISFKNLLGGRDPKSSTNLQFEQFPSDFDSLPTVSFVIPNLINDMHDPWDTPAVAIKHGDDWLRKNLDGYYQWSKTHNSLLILTFDENEDSIDACGLTNPASAQSDSQNVIPTIIAGAHVKHGDFAEGKGITHVNILRTIEAMYGLRKSGAQQRYALEFGISSDGALEDIFER